MTETNVFVEEGAVLTRITDYLHQQAKRIPLKEAVVFEGQRLNFQDLEKQVTMFARALLAMGVKKGDRVAVLCTPRTEYWVSFLATAGIGAVWLGINPKYSLDECRYVIKDAKPKLLFAITEFEGREYRPFVSALMAEYDCLNATIALTGSISGTMLYSAFLNRAFEADQDDYNAAAKAVRRLDPALLVYTSGSSDKPKGALVSHYGLCFGAVVQNKHFLVERPCTLCCFPINHVASVADTCCVALVNGGTLHLHERFIPQRVLECIQQEPISYWLAVPTMLLLVLDHPLFSQTDFSNFELIMWGGAALPEPVIKRLQELVPRLMSVYGMTETAANTTYTSPDASLEELRDSIGRPTPAMPCRIVNERGGLCEPLEHGELQFKGDYLFLGYFNKPQASRQAFTADGWLHTGDVGYWRKDGNITLVGRLSEMYKSGGYNIYPREIELLLESHPAVDMVAVVSVPHKLYQEVGVAYVIPAQRSSSTGKVTLAEELRNFCKEHLANYKVPKQFIISNDLPTLPVGKVDKVELKKRIASPAQ